MNRCSVQRGRSLSVTLSFSSRPSLREGEDARYAASRVRSLEEASLVHFASLRVRAYNHDMMSPGARWRSLNGRRSMGYDAPCGRIREQWILDAETLGRIERGAL